MHAIGNEGEIKMDIMKIDMWKLAGLALVVCAIPVAAAESPFITVEERLQKMDKDHDGMVTVEEVRAYIETVHGKDFNKLVMDEMVSAANSKSCGSPFSRSFY
ncbi:calcium-binding protein [Methylovorus sp. SPW-M1]